MAEMSDGMCIRLGAIHNLTDRQRDGRTDGRTERQKRINNISRVRKLTLDKNYNGPTHM